MTPGQVVERARLNVENTATRIAARARAATTATVAASNGHAKHRPEVS